MIIDQIKPDLEALARKHGIKLGIILTEDLATDIEASWRFHVITFEPHGRTITECSLADLFIGCRKVSETFRAIIEHVAWHTLQHLSDVSPLKLRAKAKSN